jgi:SAM-dependent methyltransferase
LSSTAARFAPQEPQLRQLSATLQQAGYTSHVLARVGRIGKAALPVHEQLIRCDGDEPLQVLCRVFLLATREPIHLVERALAPCTVAGLISAGLLIGDADIVQATAAVVPLGDLYILRDFSPAVAGKPAAADHVLAVGAASVLTESLTVRGQGETMLDLGCGQGVQMLAARRHASRIIGTDINERALQFAAMNLAINSASAGKIAATELRLGSFFEPVEDLRNGFDLIVSNPPFVITPSKDVVGFTSSLEGDGAVQTLFSQAPGFLRDGGWCIGPACWYHRTPDDWSSRPSQWIAGKGVDAFIGRLRTYHPRDYAMKWLTETHPEVAPTAATVNEWTRMFEQLDGAGAVTFGFIVLRKRAGSNWIAAESLDHDAGNGPAGEQLRRIFESRTLLHALGNSPAASSGLLERRYQASPHITYSMRSHLQADGWKNAAGMLATSPGFPWPLSADESAAMIIGELARGQTPKQAITTLARRGGLDVNQALTMGSSLVRTLLERGLLTPAR